VAILIDISLLKRCRAFRAVSCARFISILALGLLAVALPVQIQQMTGSTWQVSLAVVLAGCGMFAGLIYGGVLADRMERRKLILFARSSCGVGFLGLWLNALLPAPSLGVIYLLSVWDGFLGAVGVTALLAATPALVGRENLPQAGAIVMLSVRFGAILSPMVGGVIIASYGVAWNYALATIGTFITLIPLLRLPKLPPPEQSSMHPWQSMLQGWHFLLQQRLLLYVTLLGGVLTMMNAVRVLYPGLADSWHISQRQLGLLYAAIPLGAALAALTSGKIRQYAQPGWLMTGSSMMAFSCLAASTLLPHYFFAWSCLALFGYFSGINSLLQYTLIQKLTPDNLLGRVNGLWTAQNVTGDALGALLLGACSVVMPPALACLLFGGLGALAANSLLVMMSSHTSLSSLGK
jgi:ENTS family enterobactin (siderophore) exporter